MSKTAKSVLYNFLGFGIIYGIFYFGIINFLPNITSFWIPVSAAIASSFLAPKFQVLKGEQGDKLFMKVIFLKGIREIN